MDDGREPGTLRPGGRTARVRAAVLQAAGDALAQGGLDGLDLADIAARAGVGRTTVYRRWGNVTGLVADLLADMAEQSLPRSDTGSLLGDLRANARLVRRTLTDPRLKSVLVEVFMFEDVAERITERFFRAGWTLHNEDVIEYRPGPVQNLIFRR